MLQRLSASSQQAKAHNSFNDEEMMSVTPQQDSTSRTQAAKNDGNSLSSARTLALSCDDNPSLASQCMTFQSRIDSVRLLTLYPASLETA
jgi:hypothetical protein